MAFSIRSSINSRNCIFCHNNNSRSAGNVIFGPNVLIWVIHGSNNSRNSDFQSSNFYNSQL